MKREEIECFDCKYKVGIGMALRMCYENKIETIDYEGLKEDYITRKGTPQEIMDILEKSIEEETQAKKDIRELKGLMGIN